MPRPLQRGQVFGLVPGFAPVPEQVGQVASIGTVTEISVPLIAWAKDRRTSVSRSRPRWRPAPEGPPARRPNRSERMSPKEPTLVRKAEGSKRKPAPPNMPPASYCLRFSGSESTEYASWICLKRSSAPLSWGLASGWYWRGGVRVGFFISPPARLGPGSFAIDPLPVVLEVRLGPPRKLQILVALRLETGDKVRNVLLYLFPLLRGSKGD